MSESRCDVQIGGGLVALFACQLDGHLRTNLGCRLREKFPKFGMCIKRDDSV